jgi:hypothetical protein
VSTARNEKETTNYSKELTKVMGTRPHPRDGHTAVVHGSSLLLLFGDRHKRPFNDFYLLDLQYIMARDDDEQRAEEGHLEKILK